MATKKPRSLDRSGWIDAARETLIEGGIRSVRIEPLARRLGVTTGSFYWHFKKLGDLLAALAQDWEARNSTGLFRAVAEAGPDPIGQVNALVDVWIEEHDFSPAYDSAMRDWARQNGEIEARVRRIDNRRIAVLRNIFLALGYDAPEAFIRARVTYFHQVGYYAMRITESKARRRQLKPLYLRTLIGRRVPTKKN